MALTVKKNRPSFNPELLRVRRLDRVARAAIWWLLIQGLVDLLMGPRLSLYLDLRFTPESTPVLSSLGLAYLLLGLYLRRSLAEPEHQYLRIDLLLLFFWLQVVLTLKNRIGGTGVFPGEWAVMAINLAFGVALMLWRTSSAKMAPDAPEAKDVKRSARETIDRLKGLLEEKKRSNPLPTESLGELGADGKRKSLSEATPHLD
jgi:hypothetical protein